MNETAQQNMENHPVIRTLYDHVDEVTCLAFHPTDQILASGSRDYTLKLFDYSKPSAKRAFKYIQVRISQLSVVIYLAKKKFGNAFLHRNFSADCFYQNSVSQSNPVFVSVPLGSRNATFNLLPPIR